MRLIDEPSSRPGAADSGTPHRGRSSRGPQAVRSVNATALSRWIVPGWLRRRAISVDVSTPNSTYSVGECVPFTVTMTNSLPFPITIRTRSPVLWTWRVDGALEASRVPLREPPDEPGAFQFARGERKRFRRRWRGTFTVDDREWELAAPGAYTIGAGINVPRALETGLADETTVRLRRD